MSENQKLTVSLEPDNERTTKTVELGRFFARAENGELVASLAISARIVMMRNKSNFAPALAQLAQDINTKIRQWNAMQIAIALEKGEQG